MTEFQSGALKTALLQKIKEVALKIFLIDSQHQYESISIKSVNEQFEIEKPLIFKEVSKLIMSKTLKAKIDSKSQTIALDHTSSNVGTIPTTDRSEIEFLQMQHLEKI